MRSRQLRIVALLLIPTLLSAAATPNRTKGISMHMLPKRVADIGGKPWGFSVDYASHLKPETSQPVLQTVDQFLQYVQKQDQNVQENGVWIVTTHPDAYSEPETKLLQDVIDRCQKEHIVLFVSRASDLPNGWKRY